MDFQQIAAELVRVRRGARTQNSLSRKLGYQSNAVFAWESGRDMPSADAFFRLVVATGKVGDLSQFYRGEVCPDLTQAAGVSQFCEALCREADLGALSEKLEVSRHSLGRWLRGQTKVPLWGFLGMIEHTTFLLFSFLEQLCDVSQLPSVAKAYKKMSLARQAATENPWSHAIVHLLGTEEFKRAKNHPEGMFAARLGISIQEERTCLQLLLHSGQIKKRRLKTQRRRLFAACDNVVIDTRAYPEATRQLASFWMRQGAEKVLLSGQGKFAFNTFTVSEAGLERLKSLQSQFFQKMRQIVEEDDGEEVAAVAAWQLYKI